MKKIQVKSPQNSTSPPPTNENKSPSMANSGSNKMMMSWLSKGAAKAAKPADDKKPALTLNKSPIKSADTSKETAAARPASSKSASSRLKNLISESDDVNGHFN